jgi:hypothetical protein
MRNSWIKTLVPSQGNTPLSHRWVSRNSGAVDFDFKSGALRYANATGSADIASRTSNSQADLLPLARILRDVDDFMFEDEQVGRAFSGQPHHVLIVIFDPPL